MFPRAARVVCDVDHSRIRQSTRPVNFLESVRAGHGRSRLGRSDREVHDGSQVPELLGCVRSRLRVGAVPDDTPLRAEFELDSLDFLTFVETLAQRSGVEITEDDYARLVTMHTCVAFLTVGGT